MEVIRDIQHRYVELGYYVKEANIFRVPLFGAPIYSTIALETILYSLSDKYRLSRTKYVYRLPLRDAGIQKQIRAALALGIISQVHIPENYRV